MITKSEARGMLGMPDPKRFLPWYERYLDVVVASVIAGSLLAVCLVLGACTSVSPVVTTPEKVFMPGTQTPCKVKPVPVPQWATDVLPATATLWQKAKAMGVEIVQRQAYETDVTAALAGCTTPVDGTPPTSPASSSPAPSTPASPTVLERFKSLFQRSPSKP